MGSSSIMGSFGGAFARAKTFALTQVNFQFNNEQKFKYHDTKTDEDAETKRLKTVPKSCYTKTKTFWRFFFYLFVSAMILK